MLGNIDRILVERGVLSEEHLRHAAELAARRREPLVETIVKERLAKEEDVLQLLGEHQGVRFVNLKEDVVEEAAVKAVSARLVSHYSVMPVSLNGGVLTLAVSNPMDMSSTEDIETNLGFRVERVFACRDDIAEAIRKHYGVGADTVARIMDDMPRHEDGRVRRESHDLSKMAEDASVVKLVNQLFQQAIHDRATDIHFELFDDGAVVRRRIDGVLHDTKVPEDINVLYPALVSRIKLMANLNIVERRLPQDGRVRVTIGRKQYDLRVSIIPALHGENVVVRVLPTTMLLSLEDLGFSTQNLELMTRLIEQPHGVIFVTGPTGSGKSTTLYACLSRLNSAERKIITIEDPVEYEIRRIMQTPVKPGIGLTFATALRSMLRHDPDVMMVGEVRDLETAEITIQSALTGHLVLSTLHTNDAANGAVRLVDMGVDPYLVASSIRAFTAQRLVRVICKDCRETVTEDGKTRYRGAGCRKCNSTGYRGRVALCEILVADENIRKLIMAKASGDEIRRASESGGMTSMTQDGWNKVEQGVTTADEVLRVTSW
jgi:general secretion pathway protein E/type IV pilus assembly protein PilB